MRIYEINNEINDIIYNFVDEETGEINEEGLQKLNELEQDKSVKCLSLAKHIKENELEAKAMKEAESNIAQRRKSLENKNKSLKDYLQGVSGSEKMKDAEISISYRNSEVVEIFSVEDIPLEYIDEKTVLTPDKKKIKEVLKTGKIVDGAYLVKKSNIQIK